MVSLCARSEQGGAVDALGHGLVDERLVAAHLVDDDVVLLSEVLVLAEFPRGCRSGLAASRGFRRVLVGYILFKQINHVFDALYFVVIEFSMSILQLTDRTILDGFVELVQCQC